MIDFSKLSEMTIPEGIVASIKVDGKILWEAIKQRYVSLGDSIAACQEPTATWQQEYADYQYGVGSNNQTKIVPTSYTDRISNNLEGSYGSTKVKSTSFARSGDKVADLIGKIKSNNGQNPLADGLIKADIVTVCIGANDILGHVNESVLTSYIELGDPALTTLSTNYVTPSLNALENGGYKALLDALYQANPKAKYVFTTIYNPYNCLHLDEGANGFFKPLLDWIPYIGIQGIDFDVGEYIKGELLNTSIVKLLFSRVNAIGDWVEPHINRLNSIIKNAIDNYPDGKFSYCETKAVFDTFPNRNQGSSNETKYSDLIHTEFTSGYNTALMDWGALWRDEYPNDELSVAAGKYWTNLALNYINIFASDFGMSNLATALVTQVVERVIVPNVDPHPTITGQGVMYEVFATKLFGNKLDEYTITYYANNGTNASTSKKVYTVGGRKAYTTIDSNNFSPATGYYSLNYWATSSSSGANYAIGSVVGIKENLTLYAQWSNKYTIVYKITEASGLVGPDDTGNQECYALWINGVDKGKLGTFGGNNSKNIDVYYGDKVGVIAQTYHGKGRSYITYNGTTVVGTSSDARWEFQVKGNTVVNFEFNKWQSDAVDDYLVDLGQIAYWNCYITTK